MVTDKGKAVDHSPPAPAITPEALRVLLDTIQALMLSLPSSTPAEALEDAAVTTNPTSPSSAPTGENAAIATVDGISPAGSARVAPVHNGFHCSACRAFNVGQSMSPWYVVTAGCQVGIFSSWSVVQPHITGVAHACYRRYPNRQAAQQAYNDAMATGLVCVLP